MTHFLVTGASGLLGFNFALAVDGKKHQVTGVGNSTPLTWVNFKYLQTELTAPGIIEQLVEEEKPDVILHCAALANLEACEADPARAEEMNSKLPGMIAESARRHGIQMIHISTDAVFDGTRGNYTETDIPHPLSVYANTKLQGEQAVLTTYPEAMVARVNIYGWSISGARSLAEFFVNNLQQGRQVNGFTDVFFCPMMVLDLADLLVEAALKNLHGIYHLVGAEVMSKYDFGVAIARTFGFDSSLILPSSVEQGDLVAPRAHHLDLDTHKITEALGHPLPDFENGMNKFFDQYRRGFPQYIRSLA